MNKNLYMNLDKDTKKVIASCNKQFKEYQDLLSDLQKALEPISKKIIALTEPLADFQRALEKEMKLISPYKKCIEILCSYQYVYWKKPDDVFIKQINQANNPQVILESNEDKNKDKFEKILSSLEKCEYIRNKSLLKETISTFKSGLFNITMVSLCPLLDDLISQISNNSSCRFIYTKISLDAKLDDRKRLDKIMNDFNNKLSLKNEYWPSFFIIGTLDGIFESFFANAPFDKEEPDNLNRHWIVHGRTKKEFTKFDCIKLFRLLYAMLISIDKKYLEFAY